MSVRRHVLHIVHRFDFGGLENGLVNLVNNLPAEHYQHTIVALTEIGAISERITGDNVELVALNKQPGKDLGAYPRLLDLIRERNPDVVHTRNLGTLDAQVCAWRAGVPLRIHSEHGRDVDDPDGLKLKPRVLRRLFSPLVHRWICVSADLRDWCRDKVGIPEAKLRHICNGVDADSYAPSVRSPEGAITFGTVTRFSDIKDPCNLIRAFAQLPAGHRLIMAGDGPLLEPAKALAAELGIKPQVEFLGAVGNPRPVYAELDVFVLSSKREGISNTILEAMSCGKPVIASDVGGNPEIVNAATGRLVEPENADALSEAMRKFVDNPKLIEEFGRAGRQRIECELALDVMCKKYDEIYRLSV